MINRITNPDSGVKLKKLNRGEGMTFAELLTSLTSMSKENLSRQVLIYDEEANIVWPCFDLLQAEVEFELDNETYESGQPFFVMPR